jgi:hypothetical protein
MRTGQKANINNVAMGKLVEVLMFCAAQLNCSEISSQILVFACMKFVPAMEILLFTR